MHTASHVRPTFPAHYCLSTHVLTPSCCLADAAVQGYLGGSLRVFKADAPRQVLHGRWHLLEIHVHLPVCFPATSTSTRMDRKGP